MDELTIYAYMNLQFKKNNSFIVIHFVSFILFYQFMKSLLVDLQ